MLRLFALLIMLSLPAIAEEAVIADLSQNRVSITTSFSGSEIIVFGAVKRLTPPSKDASPLEVVITVTGPDAPVIVRRKERRFGIWINTDAVKVDAAPSFYAVASSVPLLEAITETEDTRHHVSVDRAIRAVGEARTSHATSNFTDALVRIRENTGAFQTGRHGVKLTEETLFSTKFSLPANLTEGAYDVRIFLTRDGAVTATYTDEITVSKVGLERLIYNLAHEQPLVYGLLSLIIAIAAGWSASAVFRMLRI